ncbi:hypothetical protein HDU91_001133 [Kappamyces sp. JEL0680]|nr:hypothetical protein HDU91_001133 [Kappamyces sp. JEL0680]
MVSLDGRMVGLVHGVKDPSEKNERSIYVESASRKSSLTRDLLDELFSQCGKIKELHLMDAWKPPCAFVVFKKAQSAQAACGLEHKAVSRVMLKSRWDELCFEYTHIQELQAQRLESIMQSAFGQQPALVREKGTIAEFSGVHWQTSSKTLKKLFEMVSSVAYVDHTPGSTSGHVRFKTATDAQLAVSYFSRVCISQAGPDDCVGTLDAARSRQHHFNCTRQRESFPDAIYLVLLGGKKEEEYWDWIFAQREKHQSEPAIPIGTALRPEDEPTPADSAQRHDVHAPKKTKVVPTHITFDDAHSASASDAETGDRPGSLLYL